MLEELEEASPNVSVAILSRHDYKPAAAFPENSNFCGVGGGAGALRAKGDTNDVAGLLVGGLSARRLLRPKCSVLKTF